MTCRHAAGDPNCSSSAAYQLRQAQKYRAQTTPDVEKYEIVRVERAGPHLVLEVLYPNCSKCSYEGRKVMVFLSVPEVDVLRWRKIDPHFRAPDKARNPKEAPGPVARFPASEEGWRDAVAWAREQVPSTPRGGDGGR